MKIQLSKDDGEWCSFQEHVGTGDGKRRTWPLPMTAAECRAPMFMRAHHFLEEGGSRTVVDVVEETEGDGEGKRSTKKVERKVPDGWRIHGREEKLLLANGSSVEFSNDSTSTEYVAGDAEAEEGVAEGEAGDRPSEAPAEEGGPIFVTFDQAPRRGEAVTVSVIGRHVAEAGACFYVHPATRARSIAMEAAVPRSIRKKKYADADIKERAQVHDSSFRTLVSRWDFITDEKSNPLDFGNEAHVAAFLDMFPVEYMTVWTIRRGEAIREERIADRRRELED